MAMQLASSPGLLGVNPWKESRLKMPGARLNAGLQTRMRFVDVPGVTASVRREVEGNRTFIRRSSKQSETISTESPSPTSETVESLTAKDKAAKAREYSAAMQQSMGDALMYRHELGINYARVLPNLIVGSCPQEADDVDLLREEGVGTIFSLQQDPDLAYFGIDLSLIQERALSRGDIVHVRSPIRDFDPFDLRMQLPQTVARLVKAERAKRGDLYVHCTAGLGRAPATALAYMHWMLGYGLEEANSMLQAVRRCHPKLEAIRAATADILTSGTTEMVTLQWRKGGVCSSVEIAGLDVGWGQKLPLEHIVKEGRWVLNRELPLGRYLYKYIVDGRWTYNPDAPLTPQDKAGHVNNYIEVVGKTDSAAWQNRKRLLSEDPTPEERAIVKERLEALADHLQEPSST